MYNPIRRNRNIGTAKQGFRKRKKFGLTEYWRENKVFFEKYSKYQKVRREINGEIFTFVVEKTRKNCFHACTIDDVAEMLKHISPDSFPGLRTIVFRQPKRKEVFFSSVWGRLVLGYLFEKQIESVIVLEAVDFDYSVSKWSKKLNPDDEKELDRLRNDGFEGIETKRHFELKLTLEDVRNVQLYRTIPHEIGHYVQWNEDFEKFDQIPSDEKEVFAHGFADRIKAGLEAQNIIPFPRKLDEEHLIRENLSLSDFEPAYNDR